LEGAGTVGDGKQTPEKPMFIPLMATYGDGKQCFAVELA
jgi:hypothetical protein